ncbi:MAG TPA: hypothetical protein VNF26_11640 [Candidatus Baltobacterales bacterium]|nr:hypothetical protein [Candidatus Baltobacterales bacterium]
MVDQIAVIGSLVLFGGCIAIVVFFPRCLGNAKQDCTALWPDRL